MNIFRMRKETSIPARLYNFLIKAGLCAAIIIMVGVVGSADTNRISFPALMFWLAACVGYIIAVLESNADVWGLYEYPEYDPKPNDANSPVRCETPLEMWNLLTSGISKNKKVKQPGVKADIMGHSMSTRVKI